MILHSTFPSLLARNSYAGVLWRSSQNQLRNFSTIVNVSEQFPSCPMISEDLRRFLKIFRDFSKIVKSPKNCFEPFLKFSENFSKFFKSKSSSKTVWEIFKSFWKLSKISEHFRKLLAVNFPKIKPWGKVVKQCYLEGNR